VYNPTVFFPSTFISEGTINISALIVALYFGDRHFVIIEEPERNIHPTLISKVANLMQEASREKQIIVTTHSPQLVKYTELENLILIARDTQGCSVASRPGENAELKKFLSAEMGVDELFERDLLDIR
jgi:predicted ATPase